MEELIKRAIAEGRKTLTEPQAKSIVRSLGVSVPEGEVVSSLDRALEAAQRLGYPVALKVVSVDIVHKSDVGGVWLGIADEKALGQAWQAMAERLKAIGADGSIEGFLVERMAPSGGVEVIVGTIRDEQFGPVVMFGTGGIAVEVFKDVSYRLAPLDRRRALDMIRETKGAVLLEGYRGRPACNIEGLVEAMVRLSEVLYRFKKLEGLEINPMLLYKDGIIAVDAKASLAG